MSYFTQVSMDGAVAVESGANADVLFDLGLMFSAGTAGVVDLVAAHKWFNLAAMKGRIDAIGHRREIAEMMSDADIAAAQRAARAWIGGH
jgi:TPR repeat protein